MEKLYAVSKARPGADFGSDHELLIAKFRLKLKKEGKSLASMGAQMVKHLPAMWETQVQSLGQGDPLEKEMVIHSSILAWKIPWTEKPGRLQSMESQRVGHD